MTESRNARRLLTLLALFAAVGCDKSEEQKSLTADAPSAAAEPSGPVVSPEIAEAVAQVAQAPTAQGGENAPPENGILGLERANAEAPPGSPPKLTLGKAGDDPKVLLGGPEPTEERIGQMTLVVRTGPNSGMPGVALKLEVSGKQEAEGHRVGIDVVGVDLATEQPGQVPDDLKTAIATLKGTKLSYSPKDGAIDDIALELGDKADPRVAPLLLSAAADTLELALLPVPKEPVGAGGFWMVSAREKLGLGEVVGYHLIKVEAIEPGRVTLNINTKRYLADAEFQGMPAAQFMGAGSTDLVFTPGQRFPVEGRTQQSLQAVVQREDGTARPLMYDQRALFAFPPKEGTVAPAPAASP